MNSSNKEKFVSVRAKTNYTVLICETKNVSGIDSLLWDRSMYRIRSLTNSYHYMVGQILLATNIITRS